MMHNPKTLIILVLAAIAMSFAGCKTTQKNMNDAYVLAIAGREDNVGLDSTIYSQIRREMTHGSVTVDGEEVDISTQWVQITKDGGGVNESIKPYNVVVGQFKQLFNAKSMRERLIDNGWPGAFVMQSREPYYFVVVGGSADIKVAVNILNRTLADTALKMKSPLPFILEPAQHRR